MGEGVIANFVTNFAQDYSFYHVLAIEQRVLAYVCAGVCTIPVVLESGHIGVSYSVGFAALVQEEVADDSPGGRDAILIKDT